MRLTPGDIADRLTVLSVKLSRMSGNVDLQRQFSEAQAAWRELGLDAQLELEALTDVNLRGYDVVEMIYEDFRDPMYGCPYWELCGDARAQDRAEKTVRNCRMAHELNMERIRLKNEINKKAGAAIEVKSW